MFRALAGLFDAQTPLFQAFLLVSEIIARCMGDVTTPEKRAYYLSQLEAVNNVSQAIGPLIGAALSASSLTAALWRLCWIVTCSAAGCTFYVIAFFVSFFLPETLKSVLDRREMLSNLKKQNLSKKEYEERKNHMLYQLNVQSGHERRH